MGVESLVSSSHHFFTVIHNNNRLTKSQSLSANPIKRSTKFHFPVVSNYRNYHLQDFNRYAKPLRLLQATEPKFCTEPSQAKEFLTFDADRFQSLFNVKLQTSNAYGSNLNDQNAGVLLCLIDRNGDCILQRIPAISKSVSAETSDMGESDPVHFQRGSVDEFTFKGPKLDEIEAQWISLESGQWRLAGVSLTVISSSRTSLQESGQENFQFTAFQYESQVDDILLGEGTDISILELRPTLVSELPSVDLYNLLGKTPSESTSTSVGRISNEASMKEYADLKLSLLSYDAALIFVGTVVANFAAGENSAFAFFIGGIFGFSYLLLLQRSVDGLPSSPSESRDTGIIDQLLRGFRGTVLGLALAIGLTSVAVKYTSGDLAMVLTPKELLVGTMGFLACKVAVVLAAFRPMSTGLKENEQ